MQNAITTLIFDLDGTLFDTRFDLTDAVNSMLLHFGHQEITEPEVTAKVGNGITKLVERVLGLTDPEIITKYRTFFYEYYAGHVADKTAAYHGIDEVLNYYKNKKLAIATNKDQLLAQKIVAHLGFSSNFEAVIGGRKDIAAKPAPDMLLQICDELQTNPAHTVMIGDSGIDIEAGKRAGMKTCAVFYGYRPENELRAALPDFIVSRPQELIGLF